MRFLVQSLTVGLVFIVACLAPFVAAYFVFGYLGPISVAIVLVTLASAVMFGSMILGYER